MGKQNKWGETDSIAALMCICIVNKWDADSFIQEKSSGTQWHQKGGFHLSHFCATFETRGVIPALLICKYFESWTSSNELNSRLIQWHPVTATHVFTVFSHL